MLPLFTIAIFLSATLLFLIQPMVGKLILPLLGGSPSVWNTVMLFFQGMLLAGYGYAHVLSRIKSLRTQLLIHAAVMFGAAMLLPIGLPRGPGWLPDPERSAAAQVLWLLLAACGGPGFVLCSASPLIQQWFARTRHRLARDPYFLYVASNIGSMGALLGYPLIVEPNLTLSHQRIAWSVGFGVFALTATACGIAGAQRSRHDSSDSPSQPIAPAARSAKQDERALTRQRLLWIALSFVPAGLMMGATQHITTDVAAVPLLWVLPLAAYLMTFTVAFSRFGAMAGRLSGFLVPAAVVAVAVMAITRFPAPAWVLVGSHLALLTLGSMSCHGRLASLRPKPARLTEFYLLLSVGGVLAGIVCSITAPAIFNSIAEYPLFIVGACLLRQHRAKPDTRRDVHWARRSLNTLMWILVISMLPGYVMAMAWLMGRPGEIDSTRRLLFNLCWIIPAALTLVVFSRRWLYGAAVLGLLAIPWVDRQLREDALLQIRTFYGVHRVTLHRGIGGVDHRLLHGTTEHGRQWREPPLDREPMAYFTRGGPVGDVFSELDRRAAGGISQRVAVIGLGAGTLAAYGRAGRTFTFYEIDPVVKDIASDPDLFSYISQSDSPVDYVLGDARLTITRAPEANYDLIAMDAFSSDAVPVHLVTREAMAAYLRALKPAGLLMFNVTNRHLDLEPVMSTLARDAGLVGMIRRDVRLPHEVEAAGRMPSAFIVLARTREDLGELNAAQGWRDIVETPPDARVWTDDYSDLLSVVKWR